MAVIILRSLHVLPRSFCLSHFLDLKSVSHLFGNSLKFFAVIVQLRFATGASLRTCAAPASCSLPSLGNLEWSYVCEGWFYDVESWVRCLSHIRKNAFLNCRTISPAPENAFAKIRDSSLLHLCCLMQCLEDGVQLIVCLKKKEGMRG